MNTFIDAIQIHSAAAQSAPVNGPVIQRTIVDEEDLKSEAAAVPVVKAQTDANSTILLALGAVLLFLVLIIVGGVFWGKAKK